MKQENPMPSNTKMVTPSGYPFGTQASKLHNYPLTTFCPVIKIRKKKEDDAAAWKFPNLHGQRKPARAWKVGYLANLHCFAKSSRKSRGTADAEEGIKRHAEHRKNRRFLRLLNTPLWWWYWNKLQRQTYLHNQSNFNGNCYIFM